MPESSQPAPVEPERPPPKVTQGRLWRRGRLVLLLLGGLAFGHWYQARGVATETAAQLHGSVGQLGACVVGGRPPDPLNPEAARALEAMLFRRLALSLETAKPLQDCGPLAQQVKERVAVHSKNFYHRAPAEVSELSEIAERLAALDLAQSAAALSVKPEPGQPESSTQQLLRDLGRALELSCGIAQAEKAYSIGACPVPGAPTTSTPTHRVALDISVGQSISSFSLSPGTTAAPTRVLVSALGNRGSQRSWVAGQAGDAEESAAWRTLAVPADETPERAGPTASGAAALPPRLEWAAAGGRAVLIEYQRGAPRLFEIDPALTSAKLLLPEPARGDEPAAAATSRTPQLLPINADVVAAATSSADGTQLRWLSTSGKQIRTETLKAQLIAALLNPPRLLVLEAVTTAASPAKLAVWAVTPSGLSRSAELDASGFSYDPSGTISRCAGSGPNGGDLLLTMSKAGGWLLQLAPAIRGPAMSELAAPAISSYAIKSSGADRLILGCGDCSPFALRAKGRRLSIAQLTSDPGKPGAETPVETPVLFNPRAAASSVAICYAGVHVVAYSVGGAVLTQRVSAAGVTSDPIQVAGPSDQGQATAPSLIQVGRKLLLFWRRRGGATSLDRLRLEVAESQDAGVTWR